ncbi:hypothetical protein HXX76_009950 [Chlamydomonas incerta]|uniref:NAD(+) kinase n=1 Tax=Chlamydomonas incerta TaxID=51695 RepID=A0A835T0X8_CHLIN|nr:hypothetical protein HXX76_009950 [Chlamydomonas incerta]|eukprot:KAG2430425.1 hypothetical protein HXX76_009950 [Chlamydomonas incerta]
MLLGGRALSQHPEAERRAYQFGAVLSLSLSLVFGTPAARSAGASSSFHRRSEPVYNAAASGDAAGRSEPGVDDSPTQQRSVSITGAVGVAGPGDTAPAGPSAAVAAAAAGAVAALAALAGPLPAPPSPWLSNAAAAAVLGSPPRLGRREFAGAHHRPSASASSTLLGRAAAAGAAAASGAGSGAPVPLLSGANGGAASYASAGAAAAASTASSAGGVAAGGSAGAGMGGLHHAAGARLGSSSTSSLNSLMGGTASSAGAASGRGHGRAGFKLVLHGGSDASTSLRQLTSYGAMFPAGAGAGAGASGGGGSSLGGMAGGGAAASGANGLANDGGALEPGGGSFGSIVGGAGVRESTSASDLESSGGGGKPSAARELRPPLSQQQPRHAPPGGGGVAMSYDPAAAAVGRLAGASPPLHPVSLRAHSLGSGSASGMTLDTALSPTTSVTGAGPGAGAAWQPDQPSPSPHGPPPGLGPAPGAAWDPAKGAQASPGAWSVIEPAEQGGGGPMPPPSASGSAAAEASAGAPGWCAADTPAAARPLEAAPAGPAEDAAASRVAGTSAGGVDWQQQPEPLELEPGLELEQELEQGQGLEQEPHEAAEERDQLLPLLGLSRRRLGGAAHHPHLLQAQPAPGAPGPIAAAAGGAPPRVPPSAPSATAAPPPTPVGAPVVPQPPVTRTQSAFMSPAASTLSLSRLNSQPTSSAAAAAATQLLTPGAPPLPSAFSAPYAAAPPPPPGAPPHVSRRDTMPAYLHGGHHNHHGHHGHHMGHLGHMGHVGGGGGGGGGPGHGPPQTEELSWHAGCLAKQLTKLQDDLNSIHASSNLIRCNRATCNLSGSVAPPGSPRHGGGGGVGSVGAGSTGLAHLGPLAASLAAAGGSVSGHGGLTGGGGGGGSLVGSPGAGGGFGGTPPQQAAGGTFSPFGGGGAAPSPGRPGSSSWRRMIGGSSDSGGAAAAGGGAGGGGGGLGGLAGVPVSVSSRLPPRGFSSGPVPTPHGLGTQDGPASPPPGSSGDGLQSEVTAAAAAAAAADGSARHDAVVEAAISSMGRPPVPPPQPPPPPPPAAATARAPSPFVPPKPAPADRGAARPQSPPASAHAPDTDSAGPATSAPTPSPTPPPPPPPVLGGPDCRTCQAASGEPAFVALYWVAKPAAALVVAKPAPAVRPTFLAVLSWLHARGVATYVEPAMLKAGLGLACKRPGGNAYRSRGLELAGGGGRRAAAAAAAAAAAERAGGERAGRSGSLGDVLSRAVSGGLAGAGDGPQPAAAGDTDGGGADTTASQALAEAEADAARAAGVGVASMDVEGGEGGAGGEGGEEEVLEEEDLMPGCSTGVPLLLSWPSVGEGDDCRSQGVPSDVAAAVDFVVVLGGDGTVLWTCHIFGNQSVPPVVPFNLGSLGFLTPFDPAHVTSVLQHVMEGGFPIMLRHRLHAHIVRAAPPPGSGSGCTTGACPTPSASRARLSLPPPASGGSASASESDSDSGATAAGAASGATASAATADAVREWVVLNEVVIDRGISPFLTNLECYCDGSLVTHVQGDGLIVATPTGSTAYNLAAGGSMVHPQVPGILFTPICPHSLSFRPLIFPDYVQLCIQVPSNSRAQMWCSFDGKDRQPLNAGDAVMIRMSAWPVPTVCSSDASRDWFSGVREGLHWNMRRLQAGAGQ